MGVVQEHVAVDPLRGVERRRGVVIPTQHPDLQEGVLRHALVDGPLLAQVAAPAADREVPGVVDPVVGGDVGPVRPVAQLVGKIVVVGVPVAELEGGVGGVAGAVVQGAAGLRAGDPAVVPAHRQALVVEQLGAEVVQRDAQVLAQHVVLLKTGVVGQLPSDGVLVGLAQGVAHEQRGDVFLFDEGPHLGEIVLQRHVPIRLRDEAVIPGVGGKGGDVQRVGGLVSVGEYQRREIVDGGDQHQPVQVHGIGVRQVLTEAHGAGGAVGLPGHILPGAPPAVAVDVLVDEVAEGADVVVVADERRQVGIARGAGVAGAHGVDDHEVRQVQQGVLVVRQTGRQGEGVAVVVHVDAPWPQAAHVQKHAARARPAVEGEGDRPCGGILRAVQRVGREEDLAGLPAGLKGHRSGGGRVGQFLPLDASGVLRGDEVVLRHLGGLGRVGRFGRRRGFLREAGQRCRQQHADQYQQKDALLHVTASL